MEHRETARFENLQNNESNELSTETEPKVINISIEDALDSLKTLFEYYSMKLANNELFKSLMTIGNDLDKKFLKIKQIQLKITDFCKKR